MKFVVLWTVFAFTSAQSPGNPPCFLCGTPDATISNPEAVIPIPPEFEDLVTFDITCQIGKDFGEQGFVTPQVCDILLENLCTAQEICGCSNFDPGACGGGDPTASPTVGVTDEPTASPTEVADTEAPTAIPTEVADTEAPTASPTEVAVTEEPTASPTDSTEEVIEPTTSPTAPPDVTTASPTPGSTTQAPTPATTSQPTPVGTLSPTAVSPGTAPPTTSPVSPGTASPGTASPTTTPVSTGTASPTTTPVSPGSDSPTTFSPGSDSPTTFSPGTATPTTTPVSPGTSPPTTTPGSSLVCENGKCTFSRVDTNGFALNPYTKIPTMYPTVVEYNDGASSTVYATESDDPAYEDVVVDAPPIEPYNGDMGPFNETTIAPWTDPVNQDALSETVAITRDYRGGIFNALDPDDIYNSFSAPSGTEWALLPSSGLTFEEARCQLNFGSWYDSFAMGSPEESVGKAGVVHLIEEDIYYNIMFTQWTSDNENYPNQLGGGFQYIRDEVPISTAGLPACPVCSEATTNPKQIIGPIDDQYVTVEVEGVTPESANVTIIAVGQDSDPKCNSLRDGSAYAVRPNARDANGNSVMLRRTQSLGPETPFWYTIYFLAESEGGTCRGETRVCVPVPGFSCDDNVFGYDATSQKVCLG